MQLLYQVDRVYMFHFERLSTDLYILLCELHMDSLILEVVTLPDSSVTPWGHMKQLNI